MNQVRKANALKITKAIVGSLGILAVTLYPIFIYPMQHPDDYKLAQEYARDGVDREKIQPGGMKIWSDPFGRK